MKGLVLGICLLWGSASMAASMEELSQVCEKEAAAYKAVDDTLWNYHENRAIDSAQVQFLDNAMKLSRVEATLGNCNHLAQTLVAIEKTLEQAAVATFARSTKFYSNSQLIDCESDDFIFMMSPSSAYNGTELTVRPQGLDFLVTGEYQINVFFKGTKGDGEVFKVSEVTDPNDGLGVSLKGSNFTFVEEGQEHPHILRYNGKDLSHEIGECKLIK